MTGSTVSEGETDVDVRVSFPFDGKIDCLTRINPQLAVISAEIIFKKDDARPGIFLLTTVDTVNNVLTAREVNFERFPAMCLRRDPLVDAEKVTVSTLGTVGDTASFSARTWFLHCGEW